MSIFFCFSGGNMDSRLRNIQVERRIIMKKLSLLKPDKRQVFLEKGKGQSVNYLNIPKDIDIKSLEKTILTS